MTIKLQNYMFHTYVTKLKSPIAKKKREKIIIISSYKDDKLSA